MLSFGRFLIDCASLVVSVAGLTAGAYGVRRRVLPVWRGAPARLAEIIFAIALLVIVAQILALAGGFVTRWVVPACLVAGAAGWWVGRGHRRPVGQPLGSEAPATAPAWTLAALAAIAVTVAQWGVGVRDALTHGMTTHDTLFYHGPDVARFVQGGSPLDQSYAYSDPVVNFFPMNSELIHAFGVVLMGFDSLSPFITLAWLGVAFLAAWCIGRPYGLGAPAVCVRGSGARLATARLEPSPAGMYNDIAVIALILGAGRFAHERRGSRSGDHRPGGGVRPGRRHKAHSPVAGRGSDGRAALALTAVEEGGHARGMDGSADGAGGRLVSPQRHRHRQPDPGFGTPPWIPSRFPIRPSPIRSGSSNTSGSPGSGNASSGPVWRAALPRSGG